MNWQEANTNVGLLSKQYNKMQTDGNSFSICSMCHCHNLLAHNLSAEFIHLLLHGSLILYRICKLFYVTASGISIATYM